MSTTITEASLTNFQRVSFAKIEPSGNLIVLAGKNASGKTSTLDGIQATLCGHNGREIKRPVLDGHGKAIVDVKLSDGSKLTRSYTPSGTTLKGVDPEGGKFIQADVDRRLSSLGIDGRKFITLGEKEQLKTLLSIVDLPFDPAELDRNRKQVFDARADVGRQGKAIGDAVVDRSLPTEETSAGEIIASIRAAEEANRERDMITQSVEAGANKVANLTAQIAELTKQLEEATAYAQDRTAYLATLPEPTDTTELEQLLASVEESNAAIRANNVALAQAERKDSLSKQYETFTTQLENIDKRKVDGLAAAEMPVEGLSFDDEGVLYQGVPFSRASGREQLIVSCAMIMATDPEIRVIVVRDGNVLDMEGMQLLQDMAEATDFQIFIEIVADDAGDHEYYFTEGAIA